MKPVELEILMKDGLTPGLKNAGRIVRQFSGDSKAALKELEGSYKAQREYIEKLEKELFRLEKSLKSTAAGSAEWDKIKTRISEVTAELAEEKPLLDELKSKYDELKDSAESADSSLRTQVRNLNQEIASLMVAYTKLSEEEKATAEGRALQKHIDTLIEEAGTLRDAMVDASAAINNAASDTRGFDQLSGALQLAIDGFGLATGAAEVFGIGQKELIEVQTKLQAAIVASNALSSIQNNLQKQSALMQGIQIIQTKAAATAENIKTAAQGKGVIVTKAATIAQAAFNAVANANPYVLLATACLTVVGALWAFSKGSKAAKEAEEERQKQMEEAKRKEEEFKNSVVSAASASISKYFQLKKAWEELGDSLQKRQKFIEDHKDAFRQLGVEINNVGDAQRYLAEQTKLAMEALALQAVSDSLNDDLKERLKPYSKIWSDNQKHSTVSSGQVGSTYAAVGTLQKYNSGDLTDAEFNKYYSEFEHKDRKGHKGGTVTEKLYMTKATADKINADRAAAARKKQEEALAAMEAESQSTFEAVSELNKKIKGLYDEMELKTVEPNNYPEPKPQPNPNEDDRVKYEERVAEELQNLRWKNEQEEINQLEDESEKRRRQVALNYEKQLAEIKSQEDKWKESQKGILTEDQSNTLAEARRLANSAMQNDIKQIEKDEIAKNRAKLDELLGQYKDFDQRRLDIEKSYAEDMAVLNAELTRRQKTGEKTEEIEASIRTREEAYRNAITTLQGEILQATDFYDKLFGTVSEKGYNVLKDFYKQAVEVLENAKADSNGVEISIPVKDADGKFVKQTVKITVDEYRRMLKQVQEIKKQLEKDNPFAAFRTSWSELLKAMKTEDGDVTGALKNLNDKGKEVTKTIRGWGDSLGEVFGSNFKKSMNEIMEFCDGAMDLGTGIAQIWTGDIVGGITNSLSGLGSIFSLFSSWKAKMEEMKREWYIAEIETNRSLRERTAIYAANRSQISDIIKDVELLNWLIERGYAKEAGTSVWDAQMSSLQEYMKNLKAETSVYDELWARLQNSQGHYEWGNSLNGGSATWSLRGYNDEMIELWYNQGKLSDEAKAYYEAWKDSGKTIEELIEQIEECKASMREMVMGVSFDSFLSNSMDALKKMRGDISSLGEFTEETLANAILNGFMYKDFASVLEPIYNELSDALIEDRADSDYLAEWRERYEEIMRAAGDRLEYLSGAMGVDLSGTNGTSQSGRSGAFTALSQDQGTKLEGLFVSVQMHVASIDEKMEDVGSRMTEASDRLRKIEENTKRTADKLDDVNDGIQKIIRDGVKTR